MILIFATFQVFLCIMLKNACKAEKICVFPMFLDYGLIQIRKKKWEKEKSRKLSVSYIVRVKQKSMQFPNHGMSEFP